MSMDRLIEFYHTLSPASVERFPEFYSATAYFKDPFNEVWGVDAIQRIFTHMFRQVDEPCFMVTETVGDAQSVMLVWEFYYRVRLWGKGAPQIMRGVSHLRFDPDGLINYHRDYWDAAEELYMKMPAIGGLMKCLRRIISA